MAELWNTAWLWLDPGRFPGCQCAPVSWWSKDAHREGEVAAAGLLRLVIGLEQVPTQVHLRLSADSRYRLWINETWIGAGPALVGGCYGRTEAPDWWYYDGLDVTGYLRPGRNVFAVEVTCGPDQQTYFSMGRPAFAAELRGPAPGGVWRGIPFAGYRTGKWAGLTRSCDLGCYPPGWLGAGFDDSAWPALVPVPGRAPLLPHDLPPLAEKPVAPAGSSCCRFTAEGPDELTLDFGELLAGHLRFTARATAGTRLEVGFNEMPTENAGGAQRVELTLPEGRSSYQSAAYFSARQIRVRAQFPPGAGELALYDIELLTRSQPLADRGEFACSDPYLDQLWRICRSNLRLCLQDIHLDSPHHQEPLGDHGDYLVEMLMAYYAFGDYALAHQDLRRMAEDFRQTRGATFHTSYALLMPDLARNLLLHTGNRDTAAAVLPAIRAILSRTLGWRGEEGLLSQAPNYMFVDWFEHAGANYHHPPAAQGMGALAAFTVRALRQAAQLCRDLGLPGTEPACWDREAAGMAQAFRARLWDAGRGLFRDGIAGLNRMPKGGFLPPDGKDNVFTRHTNILAVWAGIVDDREAASILTRAMDDAALPEPQPYFQHYLLDAMDLCGLFGRRARRQLDLWRGMLTGNPMGLREMWNGGDWSHAWGGTPLYQLSRRVLGVEPAGPDWDPIRLRPQPLDLAWARGVVPTSHGDLQIAWQRQGGNLIVRLAGAEGRSVNVAHGREIAPEGRQRVFVCDANPKVSFATADAPEDPATRNDSNQRGS